MIVVAIIGILAAIAIPAYIGAQEKARKSNLQKAAASAEADLSHWINSALKGFNPNLPQAALIEVDTNWNGRVEGGVGADLNNADLYVLGGNNAANGAALCYAGARTQNANGSGCGTAAPSAELSPWSGMDACTANDAYLFRAAAAGTPTPFQTGTVFTQPDSCKVNLLPADIANGGNRILVYGVSNGPGGSASASGELMTQKIITAE